MQPVCLLCHGFLNQDTPLKQLFSWQPIPIPPICPSCRAKFEWLNQTLTCPKCARAQANTKICHDCIIWHQQYPKEAGCHHALVTYNEQTKEFFKQYKQVGDYQLRSVFEHELRQLKKKLKADVYLLIPPDPKRLKSRGFDPVRGLFEQVFTCRTDLKKMTHLPEQSKQKRQARLLLPQPFKLEQPEVIKKYGKKVVLIDDIYTTGRTLFHARTCLRQAGFGGIIHTLSIAR